MIIFVLVILLIPTFARAGLSISLSASQASDSSVLIVVELGGSASQDIWSNTLKLCVYLALTESFDIERKFNDGFPSNIYSCLIPTPVLHDEDGMYFNISKTEELQGVNPGTIRFKSILVDFQSGAIHAAATALCDVLEPPSTDSARFEAVLWDQVEAFRRSLPATGEVAPVTSVWRLGIFLKDTSMHGANARLVRSVCQSQELYTRHGLSLPIYVMIVNDKQEGKHICLSSLYGLLSSHHFSKALCCKNCWYVLPLCVYL